MRPTIIELREFYASPRGQMVAARLRHAVRPRLPGAGSFAVFGYGPPVLNPTDKAVLLMPAAQGVAAWPRDDGNRAVLVEEALWPLSDQSLDAVLLLHGLESAPDPAALLDEAWRVLKPNGRLIVVASNRAGLWARAEATPFGRGQPFTATQLRKLLYTAQFVPERWQRALYTPPFKAPAALGTAWLWEALGPRLLAAHGGVIVMGAAKQLYAPTGLVKSSLASKFLSLPQIAAQPLGAPMGQNRVG